MTVYLSRSAWGAQPPNRQSPLRGETTRLFVHHSATAKPSTVDGAGAQWRAIQADHLQRPISSTNPTLWADIAYNIGIGPGVILEGRGWDVRGGGTGPGNKVPYRGIGTWDSISASICVLGNFEVDRLDDATSEALIEAMREARRRYGDGLIVMGDRDVNSTACCGNYLYSQLDALWIQSEDDMPSAKEIAEAILNEPVTVHDYDTGQSLTIPLRQAEGWRNDELSQIRHHLLGQPMK